MRMLLTLLIFLSLIPQAHAKTLFVLGDSMVDSGNMKILTLGILPYNPLGRFSDHKNYADYVAERHQITLTPTVLKPGNNYAVAGATATGNVNSVWLNASKTTGFDDQVKAIIQDDNVHPEHVYLINIGTNDLLGIAYQAHKAYIKTQTSSRTLIEDKIDPVVKQITEQLKQLQNAGAKQLIIANIAPFYLLPRIHNNLQHVKNKSMMTAEANHISTYFNTQLLSALKKQQIQYTLTDIHQIYRQHVNEEGRLIATQEKAFIDDLHPSAALHRIIAKYIQLPLN